MRAFISAVLYAFLLCVSLPSFSQDGPSGGEPPSAGQMLQNNLKMLSAVHSDPQAKERALARMRERMSSRGVQDVDAKLAAISKILDEAAAMSDADFEKSKQQLASRILSQIRPQGDASPSKDAVKAPKACSVDWIDVHNHVIGRSDPAGALQEALSAMDKMSCSKMLVMPPPNDGVLQASDYEAFAAAVARQPSRFAFLGGGKLLNGMIMQTKPGSVDAAVRKQFEQKADEILKAGASGFGEMAAHHLSLHSSEHPYESAPADHPLFLLLADIAAKRGVPIDIHFDVVAKDIPTPDWLLSASPNNPKTLHANLAAFERLLDHNQKAKIVWAHAGSDNIGHWTAELSRALLKKHPNLYMSLRLGPGRSQENFPMSQDGQVKPEWLQLFEDFPTRFVIGGDNFFMGASATSDRALPSFLASKTPVTRSWIPVFLNALPKDLAKKIGYENAIAIYKIKD